MRVTFYDLYQRLRKPLKLTRPRRAQSLYSTSAQRSGAANCLLANEQFHYLEPYLSFSEAEGFVGFRFLDYVVQEITKMKKYSWLRHSGPRTT